MLVLRKEKAALGVFHNELVAEALVSGVCDDALYVFMHVCVCICVCACLRVCIGAEEREG
jgi:hypothetical protein